MILLLEKAFIHATTYTSKKTGKTIHRKAYTDKRIAKKVVAKDRINIPSIKNKSPKEVKEKLHKEREDLKDKLDEIRKHKQDLAEAKSKGESHTDKGISVDHSHHIHKHEKNLHEKLETANHKLMLHENRYELQREKGAEAKKKGEVAREKAKEKRESKKVVVPKEKGVKKIKLKEGLPGSEKQKKYASDIVDRVNKMVPEVSSISKNSNWKDAVDSVFEEYYVDNLVGKVINAMDYKAYIEYLGDVTKNQIADKALMKYKSMPVDEGNKSPVISDYRNWQSKARTAFMKIPIAQ